MSHANHLSRPLRNRKFSSTGLKDYCFWFVIGGFGSVLWVSVFQGSLLVILLWPKPDVNIPNIFDRFHPWTSDFQISMRQKYWRVRLTFEIVKVRLSAVCKQSFLSHMPLTLYKTFAWQTFASLRLFTCLVYVSTYCVPIAHLRQNKPFPLLYLGHAQIITLPLWLPPLLATIQIALLWLSVWHMIIALLWLDTTKKAWNITRKLFLQIIFRRKGLTPRAYMGDEGSK